jgi:plasmid maintenance system antidote protein VapI
MTGVPESVLCTFVNGKRSITMTTAAKLAKALELELRSKRKGR